MSDASKQGSMEFALEWKGQQAHHRERHFFDKLNLWRDFFPGNIAEKLNNLELEGTVSEQLEAGALIGPYNKNGIYEIPKRRLNLEKLAEKGVLPRVGRFFPRGVFSSFGFTSQDIRPLRILADNEKHLIVDTNHPLYGYPLNVSGTLLKILPERWERGGSSIDVGHAITESGPGLQTGIPDCETDFYADNPFQRDDQNDDAIFYQTPRMVNHIDETASEHISSIYGRFLRPGMKVLDLMSSWNSHVKSDSESINLVGLGMNQKEMESNTTLTEQITFDLNKSNRLPFDENEFDMVICTVSIEYLINPIEVVSDLGRVMKKGALFIMTFSDRWFPPKVIRIWKELHPFERMALVVDYLKRSERFTDIHTESIRGYPRPEGDEHSWNRPLSDPVFAVWGYTK